MPSVTAKLPLHSSDIARGAGRIEAAQLYRLAVRLNEPFEETRRLIAPGSSSDHLTTEYRKSVLFFFDQLVSGASLPVESRRFFQGEAS